MVPRFIPTETSSRVTSPSSPSRRISFLRVAQVDSAAAAVRRINAAVRMDSHAVRLTRENACDIVAGYDVVIDATDNPESRYLVNDACVAEGKPLVAGAAIGTGESEQGEIRAMITIITNNK